VYWQTEEFNGPARRLYERIAKRSPFIRYNVELWRGAIRVRVSWRQLAGRMLTQLDPRRTGSQKYCRVDLLTASDALLVGSYDFCVFLDVCLPTVRFLAAISTGRLLLLALCKCFLTVSGSADREGLSRAAIARALSARSLRLVCSARC
jgi:hypothetical protein